MMSCEHEKVHVTGHGLFAGRYYVMFECVDCHENLTLYPDTLSEEERIGFDKYMAKVFESQERKDG